MLCALSKPRDMWRAVISPKGLSTLRQQTHYTDIDTLRGSRILVFDNNTHTRHDACTQVMLGGHPSARAGYLFPRPQYAPVIQPPLASHYSAILLSYRQDTNNFSIKYTVNVAGWTVGGME